MDADEGRLMFGGTLHPGGVLGPLSSGVFPIVTNG